MTRKGTKEISGFRIGECLMGHSRPDSSSSIKCVDVDPVVLGRFWRFVWAICLQYGLP